MKSILFLQNMTPHCQIFASWCPCSMVAVCSEKLKWANNGYKLNEQVGLWALTISQATLGSYIICLQFTMTSKGRYSYYLLLQKKVPLSGGHKRGCFLLLLALWRPPFRPPKPSLPWHSPLALVAFHPTSVTFQIWTGVINRSGDEKMLSNSFPKYSSSQAHPLRVSEPLIFWVGWRLFFPL